MLGKEMNMPKVVFERMNHQTGRYIEISQRGRVLRVYRGKRTIRKFETAAEAEEYLGKKLDRFKQKNKVA
jgi:hypothetical protein